MNEHVAGIRCPACASDHLRWRGIENDCRQTAKVVLADQNPAAVIYNWACITCGKEFKQRIE